MDNDNRNRSENVFSRKIRAGRRRTYFFDVRTTKGNDYYLTITESKKRQGGDGYERHKIFIYKEDFNKFLEEMTAAVDYIKERMPDFDFDSFSHKYDDDDDYGDQEVREPREEYRKEAPAAEEVKAEDAEPMEDPPASDPSEEDLPPRQDPTINEDDLKW